MNGSIAKERLAAVVKPDSVTASQGDFLATHVEIKKLFLLSKFEFVPKPSAQYDTSEEEIYQKFVVNASNRHQFLVIYGQSGTGKSHLIRWLDARYRAERPENEVVLFIRRSDNTLKGTIRQLLEKPEVKGIRDQEIIKRLANASAAEPEEKLKDRIYLNFILEMEHDDAYAYEITLSNVNKKKLTAFFYNETIKEHMMRNGGPIDRIYSKVAEKTLADPDTVARFEPEDFMVSVDLYDDMRQAGADPKADKMARKLMANEAAADAKKFSDYFNPFVEAVVQRCAGIEPGDFEQLFLDIRKELYRLGKNLTLFIEDVTSFTGVDHALLNALMEEHNDRELCRLSSFVGGTNAYVQDSFRRNHRDRVTQYIYIPDNVFDEQGLYEFVGRYLNTMSLSDEEIRQWVENQALPDEYPVHEPVEGKRWEYVEIPYGKKLCLYPFTKNSIRYLYKNELASGQRTPRYLIRDIIEPVVRDVLGNASGFPGIFNPVNVNTALNYIIHQHIHENEEADRLFRFMSIWGNNEAKQYTRDGIRYLAGVPVYVYEELGLPVIGLQEKKDAPVQEKKAASVQERTVAAKEAEASPRLIAAPVEEATAAPEPEQPSIPLEKQKKLDDANFILSDWSNGNQIDLSKTSGKEAIIRKARDDMDDFLLSVIPWQSEGVSYDNIAKLKASIGGRGSAYKLVAFENQTKGSGFYTLAAGWESQNVILAFVRWREFGNQSWDYPESDFDAYLVTSWASRIKPEIVRAVKLSDGIHETRYIEAAVAAEMYRLILSGEYRGRTIEKLTAENLLCVQSVESTTTHHAPSWNALLQLLHQEEADMINKRTVRQYFNLQQGEKSSSNIVLDAVHLEQVMRKVREDRLSIPKEEMPSEEHVKLRKDTYVFLNLVASRIGQVVKEEVALAKQMMRPIQECFDDDEIEEEDIEELLKQIRDFYREVDEAQINIEPVQTEHVKKARKQIVRAVGEIHRAIRSKDALVILMGFSGDPIGAIQPLIALISQVQKGILDTEKQIRKRCSVPGLEDSSMEIADHYGEELAEIERSIKGLDVLRL